MYGTVLVCVHVQAYAQREHVRRHTWNSACSHVRVRVSVQRTFECIRTCVRVCRGSVCMYVWEYVWEYDVSVRIYL